MEEKEVVKFVNDILKQKKISQSLLAQLSGISITTISKWLAYKKDLKYKTVKKILSSLNIEITIIVDKTPF